MDRWRGPIAIISTVFAFAGCVGEPIEEPDTDREERIEQLGILVTADENREWSYTDKKSGYYYARTHAQANTDWFSGWNVNTQRILSDYTLLVDGDPLLRGDAEVVVYPHRLVRRYREAREQFELFDRRQILSIAVETMSADSIGLLLSGGRLRFSALDRNVALFLVDDLPASVLAVATIQPAHLDVGVGEVIPTITCAASGGGFFIVLGREEHVHDMLSGARRNHTTWKAERASRMETIISRRAGFRSNDESLDAALQWTALTLDQLVTEQTGYGIYAGLPWFNDYWGRDTFISLAGACLVVGEFETARHILSSFAAFQNADPDSRYYGRIPNRIRPDEVIYNTVDGTPRFVIALEDYVRYTGDKDLAADLFPVVERSIEGPMQHWVDTLGYLTHDDADTWMDAKRDGITPWSPRGNRANDIQALWYRQLRAGARFARLLGKTETGERWQASAEQVRRRFERDFFDQHHDYMADRLTATGTPDFQLRPNQLFAFDLVSGERERMRLTARVWQALVYPWGVASLSQLDESFHAYHENSEYYHKDAAYHNGTVWIWNNGIAMQRMLEAEQIAPAYALFEGMSRQVLVSGAVGSLSENMDALPRPGSTWARRSGTFLQAWSNAEYRRVWYQYFLGIRPDAFKNELILNPRIPRHLDHVSVRVPILSGTLVATFDRDGDQTSFEYVFDRIDTTVRFAYAGFAEANVVVENGKRLRVTTASDRVVLQLASAADIVLQAWELQPDKQDQDRLATAAEIFRDVGFAVPFLQPDLKSLRKGQASR